MNYGAFDFRDLMRFASVLGVTMALGLAGCDTDDGDDGSADAAGETTASTGGKDTGMDDMAASESAGEEDPDSGSDSMGGDCGASYSHATDIQPIWDAYCTMACHEEGGEWPSNDLTSGNAYDQIVGQPSSQNNLMNYVTPGEPAQSYLVHKMLGTHIDLGMGSGVAMPKARPMMEVAAVPIEDIETINCWIEGGALP